MGGELKFNSSPLKDEAWKTRHFPFGSLPIFRGYMKNFRGVFIVC